MSISAAMYGLSYPYVLYNWLNVCVFQVWAC